MATKQELALMSSEQVSAGLTPEAARRLGERQAKLSTAHATLTRLLEHEAKIKAQLAASKPAQQLKEIATRKKALQAIIAEASISVAAIMETASPNLPGDTLYEKILLQEGAK